MTRWATAAILLMGCGGSASAPATPGGEGLASPTSSAAATTSSAPVAPGAPTFDPSVERAVATVKALIVDPDETAIAAAFTDAFQRKIPVADSVDFFDRLLDGAGPCTTHTVREVIAPTTVAFRFECESSALDVTIGVEGNAPHRMNYLLIKFAD